MPLRAVIAYLHACASQGCHDTVQATYACKQQGSWGQWDPHFQQPVLPQLSVALSATADSPCTTFRPPCFCVQAVTKPKKEDIDDITSHFNINAGNPVQCLTQARPTMDA